MKKMIVSTVSFSTLSIQLPLITTCQADNDQNMYERLMIINGVRALLGLIDENDSPNLQPFFDENYQLVTRNNGKTDFHDKKFF